MLTEQDTTGPSGIVNNATSAQSDDTKVFKANKRSPGIVLFGSGPRHLPCAPSASHCLCELSRPQPSAPHSGRKGSLTWFLFRKLTCLVEDIMSPPVITIQLLRDRLLAFLWRHLNSSPRSPQNKTELTTSLTLVLFCSSPCRNVSLTLS
ncbi:unnamed protein product [Pipistrellus nathusii]|uniref:Uncharacterized protein n=1 Tax=Pipistrellus nathusii TaxID=59473 RepID=A0ABN9Z4P2_PIPNA